MPRPHVIVGGERCHVTFMSSVYMLLGQCYTLRSRRLYLEAMPSGVGENHCKKYDDAEIVENKHEQAAPYHPQRYFRSSRQRRLLSDDAFRFTLVSATLRSTRSKFSLG